MGAVAARPTLNDIDGLGLACKENMENFVPSFKVMGIISKFDRADRKSLDIETYSYETGRWTTSTLVATEELPTCMRLKFVHKGVFHWCTGKQRILVYNLNRDEKCFVLIKLPDIWTACLTATRSSTDDHLWIGKDHGEWMGEKWIGGSGILNFWKLSIGDYDSYECATTILEDQWVLMHKIRNSLYNNMPLMFHRNNRRISYREITLEALIPLNPVTAVLKLQKKIFLYNLESQSLELVEYSGHRYEYEKRGARWIPFMESRSLPTYGPLVSSYE